MGGWRKGDVRRKGGRGEVREGGRLECGKEDGWRPEDV